MKAETNGRIVQWVPLQRELKMFPSDLLRDSKTIIVMSRQPGRYTLMAYTAKGDIPSGPAYCTVIIGDPPSEPMSPMLPNLPPATAPGSQPKETSPNPGPLKSAADSTPSADASELLARIKAAYASDTGSDKGKHRLALIAIFRNFSTLVNDAYLKSARVLFDNLAQSVNANIPPGQLTAIRKIADEELLKLVSNSMTTIDGPVREKLSNYFTRLANHLEELR